jgi:hypothetical protein
MTETPCPNEPSPSSAARMSANPRSSTASPGRKISIVHDQPGVTRDRITGEVQARRNAPFEIIDTGGIGGDVDASFTEQVHAEVEIALTASDLLFSSSMRRTASRPWTRNSRAPAPHRQAADPRRQQNRPRQTRPRRRNFRASAFDRSRHQRRARTAASSELVA